MMVEPNTTMYSCQLHPCIVKHLRVRGCLVRRLPKEVEKGANDVASEQMLSIGGLQLALKSGLQFA